MGSCFASLLMAAAFGQAPDQSEWLKSVPAEVAVVARVKALDTVRDDLMAMLEAMSGNAAAMARPQIEQGMAMMEAQNGEHSTKHPFFVLLTLPKDGAMPGWAVMVEGTNYDAILKDVSGKADFKSAPKDGIDSFDGKDGQTWYATKGAGFVAFGPDQAIVKGIAKPSASLSEKLTPEVKASLLGGDLGIYVNVAEVQGQYGDQIEQGKQMFMGLIDQGGGQLDAKTLEGAKALYASLFDSIKEGQSFALNLDFAAEGLGVGGLVTVKGDSAAAKSLAKSTTGAADGLARLPGDAMMFIYSRPNPEAARDLAKLVSPGGKLPEDTAKTLDLNEQAGIDETFTAISDGANGFANLAGLVYSMPKNPAKAVEAATIGAKSAQTSGQAVIDSIKVTPEAETYKGFTLAKTTAKIDLEKVAPPNAPGGPDAMKKLMGGDTVTTWFGTDGKTFLNVGGKDFAQAKSRIDAFASGDGSLGKVKAYEAIRGKLPKEVSGLMLVSAQGLTRMVGQAVGSMSGTPVAVPSDMPKDVALLGGSLTASPTGYSFRFVVPSPVGAVIEKGMVPMLQNLGAVIQ